MIFRFKRLSALSDLIRFIRIIRVKNPFLGFRSTQMHKGESLKLALGHFYGQPRFRGIFQVLPKVTISSPWPLCGLAREERRRW